MKIHGSQLGITPCLLGNLAVTAPKFLLDPLIEFYSFQSFQDASSESSPSSLPASHTARQVTARRVAKFPTALGVFWVIVRAKTRVKLEDDGLA